MRAVRVVVHGRVQGVGFRYWTLKEASALGLSGYVRNRADGSVEGVIRGEEAAVTLILKRLADGPPLARVERIETQKWAGDLQSGKFEIR